ncbi:unnamed protein product [Schistosoma rodhaini]|uniref:Egg protein CP391S-like protein n=1 Tax=Schistosoma rodhaini TaxID=6188 RepID=A0AA85GBY2_9TREM|nr:unnamed protein product [Schistosoma rodhaini]
MKSDCSCRLLTSLYLIIVLLYNFLNGEYICEHPEVEKYNKVIYENTSYRDSLHYNYLQRIRLNQPHPVVDGGFTKTNLSDLEKVEQKFPFKYYDSLIKHFNIHSNGLISVFKDRYFGLIANYLSDTPPFEFEVLDTKDLFAIKMSFKITVNSKSFTSKTTYLIYPNGRISFYYENIPTKFDETKWKSKMAAIFQCEKRHIEHEILVPVEWIKSGTLVDFEAVGNICPKNETKKACEKAKPSDIACIWCERINICIDSNDKETHNMKVNDCRIPTLITKVVKVEKQKKSDLCLYILIPLGVSFIILCIGCIIGIWLYKKCKRPL